MRDVFRIYETGLNRLLAQLGRDHPRYTEVLVLQQRLLENLARVRLYGDTETSRAERAQIFDALNHLTLEALGDSFSALFLQGLDGAASGRPGAAGEGQASEESEGDHFVTHIGSVTGPVHTGKGDIILDQRGQRVDTGGGAYVEGDVRVEGGDFVGRDKVTLFDQREQQVGQQADVAGDYVARQAGHREAEGAALDNLGSACVARGDFHRAVECYEQAVTIAHGSGDRLSEALYLQNLGLALFRLADVEQDQRQAYLSRAADVLRQAVELFEMIEAAPLLRARARYHLGRCYHQSGRWREATALLEQARKAFSRHKARPELARALLELGQLHLRSQDFESAYIYLKDALRLFQRLKDADGIAVTQEALGSLALQTARPVEAIAYLQEARRGYCALQRDERVREVDDLLRMAERSRQIAEKIRTTP